MDCMFSLLAGWGSLVISGDQKSKRLIQLVNGAALVVISPFRNQQTLFVKAARESQQEGRPTENVHQ